MSSTSSYTIKLKSMLSKSEKHVTKIELSFSHSSSHLSKVLLICMVFCLFYLTKIFSQDLQSNCPLFLGLTSYHHTYLKPSFLPNLSFLHSFYKNFTEHLLLSRCHFSPSKYKDLFLEERRVKLLL